MEFFDLIIKVDLNYRCSNIFICWNHSDHNYFIFINYWVDFMGSHYL